ncbi:uncharacterized protein LOC143033287 [Oratosquilla oratoria]|uniref:uncharacterized protein LOC143033287 n=1 Tax=Oratosquilla oratoria TaxID=337810 RepID=UPI003F76BC4D
MASNCSSPSDDKSVTQEWLETILEGYHRTVTPGAEPQLKVQKWAITPGCSDGDGYLSDILALDVTYTADGVSNRLHLLAKLLPQDPFNRAFVIETQFDLREIKFYNEILPALKDIEQKYLPEEEAGRLAVPECFHAVYRPGAESILVLSDLKVEGYAILDLTKGLSQKQAELALGQLAKIHAASYAMQVKENIKLEDKFPYLMTVDQAVTSFQSLVDRGLPLLLRFLENKTEHKAVLDVLHRYTGQRASEVFRKVLTPSDKLNVLVHNDFWCNNLLFGKEEEEETCRIIDWQMIMMGRPSIDLALLLCTSVPPKVRRDHASTILSSYWEAFLARIRLYGIEEKTLKYTLENLKEDYESAQAMAAMVIVGSVDIALGVQAREERVLELVADLASSSIL